MGTGCRQAYCEEGRWELEGPGLTGMVAGHPERCIVKRRCKGARGAGSRGQEVGWGSRGRFRCLGLQGGTGWPWVRRMTVRTLMGIEHPLCRVLSVNHVLCGP